MQFANIQDDPHTAIIQVLRKVEESLNFLCEARNFLNERYKRGNLKTHDQDIEQYEVMIRKDKKDGAFREKLKDDRRKELEKKEEQRLKALEALSKSTFQGKKVQFRSTKKRFKAVVKKQDNLDQQTKDEKEYLGVELFDIL